MRPHARGFLTQHGRSAHAPDLEDYLLTIEIHALSGNDEQIAVDSLQKFIIDE
jgi:hypothetical protein